MATLDVSEILADSDFVDDFQVVRSQRSVNAQGLTVDTPGVYFTFGNVQPTPDSTLRRLPEAERIGDFMTVVTQFQLRALTSTTAPDQVVWNGRNYRVMVVNDWSNYGRGFVQAVCKSVSMAQDGP